MSISALDAFLEALLVERGAAANTVAAYRRDLEHAEASFGSGLEEAGEADLRRYLADLLQGGLSPRTVSRRRSALRQFFLFCAAEGYREDNPADRLDAPKTGRPLPRHLGVEEVGRLIEAIESQDGPAQLRLYCIVELLYGAGLRVSELVGLAMSDVPPGRAWLTVRGKGCQASRSWPCPAPVLRSMILTRARETSALRARRNTSRAIARNDGSHWASISAAARALSPSSPAMSVRNARMAARSVTSARA